jgi:hypothetical protein
MILPIVTMHNSMHMYDLQPLDTRSMPQRQSRNGEAIGKAGERGAERSGDQAQKLGASLAPSNIP